MKKLPVLLASLTVLLLTGCAAIDKATTSEATLLDKAEFATGINASQLSVVPGSVQGTFDSVEYKVQTKKGQIYRCYYTSMVAVKSDAICTAISDDGAPVANKKKNQKNNKSSDQDCNALLRAAGRC